MSTNFTEPYLAYIRSRREACRQDGQTDHDLMVSEHWRQASEAIGILRMPVEQRAGAIFRAGEKRGVSARQQLENDVRAEWTRRKADPLWKACEGQPLTIEA